MLYDPQSHQWESDLKHATLTVLLATLCSQSTLARAQEAAEEPLQSVTVSGVRDPAIVPYETFHGMLSKVRKVGADKVDVVVRVSAKETRLPVPGLEIALQGEQTFQKLALSPDGLLDIPVDPALLADKASFVTNKKKGSLTGEFFFIPKVPRENLRYADMAASIAAAKRALAELMPWYVRLIAPSIKRMSICYPDAQQVVGVAGAISRPANIKETNMLNKRTVYCAHFSARETEAAPDSVVTAPGDWTPLYL